MRSTTRWTLIAALVAAVLAPPSQAHRISPPRPAAKMTLEQRASYQRRVMRHDRRVLRATAWIGTPRIEPGIAHLLFRGVIVTRTFHYMQLQWTRREYRQTERAIRVRDHPRRVAPAVSGRRVTVSATCYALGGHTATGAPVHWGAIATDPSFIRTGSRLYVPGYGPGVAQDTGGAIRGAIIDVWMPTASQCYAWGRRTVTVTVY